VSSCRFVGRNFEPVDAAFKGDHQDLRTWPTLDPLTPHTSAAVERADQAIIADPTSRAQVKKL
jgi:hypothetical protein